MEVEIIDPHGFCAGVRKAIKTALELSARGETVYCLHELVHNELVVSALCARGFVFVESLDAVPGGSTVLFSAHGVAPAVYEKAEKLNLTVVDATCPFVKRVHEAARRFVEKGRAVVVIGKRNHAEVAGILGEVPDAAVVDSVDAAARLSGGLFEPGSAIGVVSQTTMNGDDAKEIVSALSTRFKVESSDGICNATKERQDAVKSFKGDALLVLGSVNSSNTKRLCEIAPCRTFRAGNMDEVRSIDFSRVRRLGVTSGASTPEEFLVEAVSLIRTRYSCP